MYDLTKNSDWSPSDLTAVQTPLSCTPTLNLDINNPADLEAQLLRLKERRDSGDSIISTVPDQPLSPPKPNTLSTYFSHQVPPSSKYLQAQLLLLTIATGIVDVATYSSYSIFVSKQTGNVISLALVAFKHDSVSLSEPNIAVAISVFSASTLIFAHTGHWIGACTRLWLLLSNLISTAFIFAAAALCYYGPSSHNQGPSALAIITLLSIGMAAQVSVAANTKVPDLNTSMITGAIVQVLSDRQVFARHNEARNRRVLFFFALMIGAFIGAALVAKTHAVVGLLVAACIKAVVTVMILF